MKPQSTKGALPTRQVLLTLQETYCDPETKLGVAHGLALLAQVTAALGGCGILHWIMT